jgi:hypothetical protein
MPEHGCRPLRRRHKAHEDGRDSQQTLLDGNAHRGSTFAQFEIRAKMVRRKQSTFQYGILWRFVKDSEKGERVCGNSTASTFDSALSPFGSMISVSDDHPP